MGRDDRLVSGLGNDRPLREARRLRMLRGERGSPQRAEVPFAPDRVARVLVNRGAGLSC